MNVESGSGQGYRPVERLVDPLVRKRGNFKFQKNSCIYNMCISNTQLTDYADNTRKMLRIEATSTDGASLDRRTSPGWFKRYRLPAYIKPLSCIRVSLKYIRFQTSGFVLNIRPLCIQHHGVVFEYVHVFLLWHIVKNISARVEVGDGRNPQGTPLVCSCSIYLTFTISAM
jgi:hypothetical protein